MSQWTALAKLQQQAGQKEDRKHPRFRAHQMNCAKGEVADFSATGLRIVYRKKLKLEQGDQVMLELASPRGILRCEAVVMWVRQSSRKEFEVGYRFLSEDTHKQIRLFESGFDPLSIGYLDN
ncbi:MAG: PilZ domain-containing protein [Phycisphaerales bacterium]|nr:PilZ domain-containing protein [Phycisphaerales bacterium]